MNDVSRALNFIEHIIEEDLDSGLSQGVLRFRFPPEPNGYLHIGHASSICLNFGLGKRYSAPVNLRFDDTNPAREEDEYVQAIKSDVEWLGYQWDNECYASDYFEELYSWAVSFIQRGMAYVDSQTSEAMAVQKGTPMESGRDSPYRDRPVQENLDLFEGMKNGEYAEGSHVLRAKIDMAAANMVMRDPIMYRVLNRAHHRTNTDWCIYPMYDWAHGQSDYIEQVTHSLCTLEFASHRELYDWFLDQVCEAGKIRPKQREFARRNLSHTIVSKRKLLQLVEDKVVTGWDDPRMPTISGMRRRGYTPLSIRNFAEAIGIAKRENVVDMAALEFHVREDLNKIAPRVMVVLDPVKLVITNYPSDQEEWLVAENNPEDENAGTRMVPFSRELFIEDEDFREDANRKYFRLKPGGEVRLKNGYIVKAESVKKDTEGNIKEIHCTYDPNSRSGSGSEESLRKVKGTLHWVSIRHAVKVEVRLYDRLFTDPTPDAYKDRNFMEFLNTDSLKVIFGYAEPYISNITDGTILQFQRLGYFCLDRDSDKEKLVFNRTVSLRDTWEKMSNED